MVVAVLSRMPIGMVGFAMLMFLREHLGSFHRWRERGGDLLRRDGARAPVQGRLIDTIGPRLPLWVDARISATAGDARVLALRPYRRASYPWVAASAGADAAPFAPPITVVPRAHDLAPPRSSARTIAAPRSRLDAVLIELNFTMGPRRWWPQMLAASAPRRAFVLSIGVAIVLLRDLHRSSPARATSRRAARGAPT
jgi:hypothetical protein